MTRQTSRTITLLAAHPLLNAVPQDELAEIAAHAKKLRVGAGTVIMEEGAAADGLYLVVAGALEVTRRGPGGEVLLARHGRGSFVGEMAMLDGSVRSATVRAVRPSRLLVIRADAFRRLMLRNGAAAWALLRATARRLAATESALLHSERLASLGTLAAGLAHELNNPVAAIMASSRHLAHAIERMSDAAIALRGAAAAVAAESVPHIMLEPAPDQDEFTLAAWLWPRGLAVPQTAARQLARCGWTIKRLHALTGRLAREDARVLLEWLAARCEVELMRRELRTAATAVADVVGAVRAQAGTGAGEPQPVDVAASIDAALTVLRPRLRAGVSVVLDVAADLPAVPAAAGELAQVWTNLMANALDAMHDDGTLTVRARCVGSRVAVDIEDTGAGIPANVRDRLFDPFFTTRASAGGSGLGLHIVREIVAQRLGGRIDVRSRPGRTVFRVVLPAYTAKADVAA